MKTMTCNDLGGACDMEFQAETFEEMAELSKKHAMEMFVEGDKAHIEAMEKMKKLMTDPKAMKKWMDERKMKFEKLSKN